MNIFAKTTVETMKQSRTRTIVSIIGVILATAMVTAVITFGFSMQNFMIEHGKKMNGDWHICMENISADKIQKLTEDPEVNKSEVLGEIGFGKSELLDEFYADRFTSYFYMQTMNPDAADMLGVKLSRGRLPENENEIIVQEYDLAYWTSEGEQKLLANIGDQITISVGDVWNDGYKVVGNQWIDYEYTEDNERVSKAEFVERYEKTYTIVGFLEQWGNSQYGSGSDVFVGEAKGAKLDPDIPYNVYVSLEHPRTVKKMVNQYQEELTAGTTYTTNEAILRWMGGSVNDTYNRIVRGIMEILILIIAVGSISLIYNTFAISMRERTVQFGILASAGATRKQMRKSMWYEAMIVGSIGIPLGLLSGIGGIAVTLHFIGEWLGSWIGGTEAKEVIKAYISWEIIPITIAVIFLILCISVWIPIRRIRKLSPLDAIRSVKDVKIKPREVRSPGFILKLFGTEGMMADKNYKRDRKKYRATIFSLTISIVLFVSSALLSEYLIGAGSFVIQAPEYEIRYETDGMANDEKYQEEAEKIAAGIDGVDEIRGWQTKSISIRGQKEYGGAVIFLPEEEFRRYVSDDTAEAVYYDEYINYDPEKKKYEQKHAMEEKGEISVGITAHIYEKEEKGEYQEISSEEIPITLSKKMETLPAYIQAREYYENVKIITSEKQKEKFRFADEKFNNVIVSVAVKAKNYNQVYDELEKEFREKGLLDRGNLTNQGRDYEQKRGMMISVKVLSYGFIILISLIAAANVFNTISTNVMLRKREFAMLRSMGMTQKMLKKMMNYECIIYGLKSMFCGALGALLVSGLMFLIIDGGIDTGFLLPWKALLTAMIWVMFVVFGTMIYAMHKIKNQNIIEELRRE